MCGLGICSTIVHTIRIKHEIGYIKMAIWTSVLLEQIGCYLRR